VKSAMFAPAPCIACLLAEDSRITEEAQRRLTRFRLAHSGATVLCDLLFEMEAQLRIELFTGSFAAE
jgi:hypothetical protein